MAPVSKIAGNWFGDRRGITSIEYALIVSFVAMAIIAAAATAGSDLLSSLRRIDTEFGRAPRP